MLKKKLLYIFALLTTVISLLPYNTNAQFYDTGQDPANIHWKQINTEHFRFIYQDSIEETAQYFANFLEAFYPVCSKSLNHSPKKIPVLLHNYESNSNGEVAWAPKRVELYTVPAQDMYSQYWYDQLAIHEFRHVVQVDKLNTKTVKVFSYFLGQMAVSAVLGVYIPGWFLEGDAVYAETVFGNSGRGRQASFKMPFKAQLLEKGKYSYDKAFFGSYKSFVPDKYTFGYYMTSVPRKYFGTDFWNKPLEQTAKVPFPTILSPFSKGVRANKNIKGCEDIYRYTADELINSWRSEEKKTTFTDLKLLSPKSKYYTSYHYPTKVGNGNILALKSSINDIDRFVMIDSSGKEKILFTPGQVFNSASSNTDSLLVWSEYKPDLRWDHRNYSEIKSYNIKTHKVKRITKKSYLYWPVISSDNKTVIAVETTPKGKYSLNIIDLKNGKLIKKITTPSNDYFIQPSWSDDGTQIATILLNKKGKSLIIIDVASGKIKEILKPSSIELQNPVFYKNFILYNANYSGVDNVYALDTSSKKTHLVISSRFGVTDAVYLDLKNSRIIYTDYNSDGNRICSTPLDETKWPLFESEKNLNTNYIDEIAAKEPVKFDYSKIGDSNYKSEKYSKIGHLFNFHSWGPISVNADNTSIKPGITAMSQNILSSMFVSTGLEFAINKKTVSNFFIDLQYKGWFPEIDLKFRSYLLRNISFYDEEDIYHERFVQQNSLSLKLTLPFNFSSGKYSRKLQPKVASSFINYNVINSETGNYTINNQTIETGIMFYNFRKSSEKDLQPRWGQYFNLNFVGTPFFKEENLGELYSAETQFYFPGIGKHHGLGIYLAYQRNSPDLMYNNLISTSRGYDVLDRDIYSCIFNYAMPIAYPDANIAWFMYLKRISATPFFEFCQGTTNGTNRDYNSVGIDVILTCHFFRIPVPIDIGMRAAYLINSKSFYPELLYSFNFNSIK
jgi:hypothetical protein